MTQFPALNINGTNGAALLDQYALAAEVVRDAIAAVRRIECHGRDYQTIDSDAPYVAYREHVSRIASLEAVEAELTAIALSVYDQIGERL